MPIDFGGSNFPKDASQHKAGAFHLKAVGSLYGDGPGRAVLVVDGAIWKKGSNSAKLCRYGRVLPKQAVPRVLIPDGVTDPCVLGGAKQPRSCTFQIPGLLSMSRTGYCKENINRLTNFAPLQSHSIASLATTTPLRSLDAYLIRTLTLDVARARVDANALVDATRDIESIEVQGRTEGVFRPGPSTTSVVDDDAVIVAPYHHVG